MKTRLDINQWERKEHFQFFKNFSEPFFGITAEVDCTTSYTIAKEAQVSFYLYYLHKSLKAANHIQEFKYRIENEEVFCYDIINASSTFQRANGTFGFSMIPYHELFDEFYPHALNEKNRVANSTNLFPSESANNVIHFSALPWIKFTSLSHARQYTINDSVPKISFGKIEETNGIKKMPVSIHVNHALADGYHVGQYFDLFQSLLNER